MPIHEFRCLKCDEVFELLMISEKDELEMKCPHCEAEDFERVLSTTSYAVGLSAGESGGPQVESRKCGAGSCSSITLPGHTKS